MRSLKDLKISLFPLLRVKGAEAQKNAFRVTVIFFFGLDCPKLFGLPLPLLKKVCLPLWKKEAKRRHETSTVNQLFVFVVLFSRERGETLFITKGFGERKGAELFLLLTRFIERTIYLLRFNADIPLLFFLRCF